MAQTGTDRIAHSLPPCAAEWEEVVNLSLGRGEGQREGVFKIPLHLSLSCSDSLGELLVVLFK